MSVMDKFMLLGLVGERPTFNLNLTRMVAQRLKIADIEFKGSAELLADIDAADTDVWQALNNFINTRNTWLDFSLEMDEGNGLDRMSSEQRDTYHSLRTGVHHNEKLLKQQLSALPD